MKSPNPLDNRLSSEVTANQSSCLSDYQMAVLSTLFDPNDKTKITDLAAQWGLEQTCLEVVWDEMHRNLADAQA